MIEAFLAESPIPAGYTVEDLGVNRRQTPYGALLPGREGVVWQVPDGVILAVYKYPPIFLRLPGQGEMRDFSQASTSSMDEVMCRGWEAPRSWLHSLPRVRPRKESRSSRAP